MQLDKLHLDTAYVGEVVCDDSGIPVSQERQAQELAWILYLCTNSPAREEIERRVVNHYNSNPNLAPIDRGYLKTSMLVSIRSLVVDYLEETGQSDTAGWIRAINKDG